jgi:hypothetical protein
MHGVSVHTVRVRGGRLQDVSHCHAPHLSPRQYSIHTIIPGCHALQASPGMRDHPFRRGRPSRRGSTTTRSSAFLNLVESSRDVSAPNANLSVTGARPYGGTDTPRRFVQTPSQRPFPREGTRPGRASTRWRHETGSLAVDARPAAWPSPTRIAVRRSPPACDSEERGIVPSAPTTQSPRSSRTAEGHPERSRGLSRRSGAIWDSRFSAAQRVETAP